MSPPVRVRAFAAAAIAVLAIFSCCRAPAAPEKTSPAPVRRIITHMPAITEIAFALGLGDRVVGVSDFCRYPPEALRLPKVGGLLNPNLETALALKPDLVVLLDTQRDLKRRYDALSVGVLAVNLDTPDGLFQAIHSIGRATGAESAATRLGAKIRADLDAARASATGPRTRTLLVVGRQTGDLREVYAAAPRSFMGAILEAAGGENVLSADEGAYPAVSVERLARLDPETVVVVSGKTEITENDKREEMRVWALLPSLAVAKTGRVILLPANPFSIPGPRAGEAARELARVLHRR